PPFPDNLSNIVLYGAKVEPVKKLETSIQVTVELHCASNPAYKKDLVVRLTADSDQFFLYNLIVTEEDCQRLKHQQRLLIDFSAFPQKFIDLLQQCIQEENKDVPRFLLQLVSSAPVFDCTPAYLNVVETNAFKHLTHLSLKLLHGTDVEIKKYLAACLKCIKEILYDEKLLLEEQLKKTKDDLNKQLTDNQKALSEKSSELDRLRSEWATQTARINDQYSQELTAERERFHQARMRWQQQLEQQRKELESDHKRSLQQLQNSLAELETINKELIERRYKAECVTQEMKAKLSGSEDECYKAKQEAQSLRQENSMFYAGCHEKDKLINQLQTHVTVFEQEIKDKDQLFSRTKEVLEATRQQKVSFEENSEKKQVQVEKLEAIVKSLSEELLKQEQLKGSMEKLEESKQLLKTNENAIQSVLAVLIKRYIVTLFRTLKVATVPQTSAQLGHTHDAKATAVIDFSTKLQSLLIVKPRYVQTNTQFLNSSTSSMTSKPKFPVGLCTAPSPDKENNFDLGSKYFKQRQDSIPLRGLFAHSIFNSGTQMAKPGHLPPASTYFCEQELEPS
ncbi:spindle assembly abnormal protein 6 homolog, partial [Chiloscyllium punctatum]|uniref:spindle assembly abnormal protein 6 homolog n=1 Tax=Chiloscyllium punctatum TaxID=137246 RepID=UPI003B6330BD